jgi:hypothetical protein
MAAFSVFFDGPQAFGIQQVEALNADEAIKKVAAIHTGSRLAVIKTAELDGCNQHKLLAAWISGKALVKIDEKDLRHRN